MAFAFMESFKASIFRLQQQVLDPSEHETGKQAKADMIAEQAGLPVSASLHAQLHYQVPNPDGLTVCMVPLFRCRAGLLTRQNHRQG